MMLMILLLNSDRPAKSKELESVSSSEISTNSEADLLLKPSSESDLT